MTTHELKTVSPYFGDVVSGVKTFEIRNNDRGFEEGDTLVLREWHDGAYTGREHRVTVTYLTVYEQRQGYVVMGILPEGDA